MLNIVFIGKPGCGKGTLTQELKKIAEQRLKDGEININWFQLSPGEIMREKMKDNDETAQILKDLLNKGNYAPNHITISIVKEAINKFENQNINNTQNNITGIIFDGFPRTIEQAQLILDEFNIDLVVNFETEDEVIYHRLLHRLNHPKSGRVYHEIDNPPKIKGLDDITGEPLVKRDDDKKELIDQRLKNFKEKTYPSFEVLKNAGLNVIDINSNQNSTIIANIVQEEIDLIVNHKLNNKKRNKLFK